jgi:hypothetical protein
MASFACAVVQVSIFRRYPRHTLYKTLAIRPLHRLTHETISSQASLRTLPTISFLRRFFGSGATTNPAIMSAAKTKAQGIIDENAVGES